MNNKILSNQIKFVQNANNIKNRGIINLNLTQDENIINIEEIEKINKSFKNDYKKLEDIYDILKNELQQIKIENDESYNEISNMQKKLDNISITNNTIVNELNLLKLSNENVNILNNKLRIENDKLRNENNELRSENNELISLKNFLIIEYEKLNDVVTELNKLN
jgi:hypothetical protein